MSHSLTRPEFRVVRTYSDGLTEFGRFQDRDKAAQMVSNSKAVLPNVPVKPQVRTVTTTYGDWEDME